MFHSIKYRFVLIYFLLVLISMSIVGSFIINRLTGIQIANVSHHMEKTLDSMITTMTALFEQNQNMANNQSELENTLQEWGLSQDQSVYVIGKGQEPKLITSTTNLRDSISGRNAYSFSFLEPELIMKALQGRTAEKIVANDNSDAKVQHIAKPIVDSQGNIEGVFYMTQSLESIYNVVDESKVIITYATIISLLITSILGYFIANSITTPIRDVTRKAREMAKGNFKQKVDVKSKDEIGQLGTMFNYLTDELTQTIEQMDLEKSKLNTIFNYMAEGVIAIDRRGNLIHANAIAKILLNLREEDFNRRMDLEQLHLNGINYYDADTLQGEEMLELKNSFYKVKYAPYETEEVSNAGIIIVFQDITQEHRLDVMRKEFVANVSHELKTPITTIKSYTETMLDTPMTTDATEHFLHIIARENNRMARLVSDLLQLSNLDYANVKWELEAIDTYEFIASALESQQVLILEKQHEIHLDVPMEIARIYTDAHGGEQILMNIISNALKYTRDKGDISIMAREANEYISIAVKDNGIGIPEEDLQHIFERFYRVEKGRSRAMGGTGLGLSIAREMLENLGGKIHVQSQLNQGTTVTLFFPKEHSHVA